MGWRPSMACLDPTPGESDTEDSSSFPQKKKRRRR
jgi:hypothetical protein